MKRHSRWALTVIFLTGLIFAAGMVSAGNTDDLDADKLQQVVLGGLLYDKWYGELDVKPPSVTHPAYPGSGKSEGSSTWRCKECHGWDYQGKDGAYKSGSHFSGIKGISGAAGGSESSVVAVLKDANHGYGDLMSAKALAALAAFVVNGQVDVAPFIQGKKVTGNVQRGARFYQTVCIRCHGADGKEINFGNDKKPAYIGTVASGNPQETLHKIRIGQPAENMPALVAFPLQDAVDVLTYAQTLPEK